MLNLILATWGAILSSILAGIKLWEVYQNRFRIKIVFNSGYQEHSIVIANLSSKPINIMYFGLYKVDVKKKIHDIDTGMEEGCNILIPSHNTTTLTFKEQYYFSLKADSKLFLTLHIIGRKPTKKQIA